MRKRLLIFGLHDSAELAYYYFTNDSEYDVAGFVVTKEFMPEEKFFHGLEIYDYVGIEKKCPPSCYDFFVPIGPRKINMVRKNFYEDIKNKGYNLPSYISPKAIVYDNSAIGDNCFILEGSVIQPFASIGNDTIIWGSQISHHASIGNHVFVAKAVVSGHVIVEDNCFIGAGAAIAECRRVREGSFICMSAAIISNTKAWSVYAGNPAIIKEKNSMEM